ncbi:MAG: hypothetical protein HKN03_11785 [Acidimicrobiales bacterium]|nr:hypothetical protein [Acidimicrobiales bacterium]
MRRAVNLCVINIVIALWSVLLLACIFGTAVASQKAVTAALRITTSSRLPPAVVGLTVMAIGTDLPEIANSLVSTASGHGDLNVGDSAGSALTQATLVMALLCIFSRGITVDRKFVIGVGVAAFFSCGAVLVMVQDGELGHLDGLLLIALWLGGSLLLGQQQMESAVVGSEFTANVATDVLRTLMWLALIGALAIGIVESFVRIADTLGIPEFVGSFIVLSIGTSVPELAVDWIAIRRGASSLAVGDVFGSSFVDASLSIGIGPAVFGSIVSDEVWIGLVGAAIGVLLAALLVARSHRYDWRLGIPLLGVYGTVQILVAIFAG